MKSIALLTALTLVVGTAAVAEEAAVEVDKAAEVTVDAAAPEAAPVVDDSMDKKEEKK